MPKDKRPEEKIRVRSLPPIKFKDRPGRGAIKLDLIRFFGFVPEEIIFQKIRGKNNKFIISAVLTKEELAKEKALQKKAKEKDKKLKEAIRQKKK